MRIPRGLCFCAGVAGVLVFAGSATATSVLVPNGGFEKVYKPGTNTPGVISGGGWNQGVGPEVLITRGTYEFADGTTGDTADVPGWLGYDRQGWVDHGGSYGRDETTGNLQGSIAAQSPRSGSMHFSVNGGAWGNSAGGLIVSESSLAMAQEGESYTVSMWAQGGATPIKLDLLADGETLTPSSETMPALTGGWQEYSKTYDATSISGHGGEALKIVLGIDRDASNTQTRFDDVSLSTTATAEPIPTPSAAAGSLALLGMVGTSAGLGRRRRT
jgi:hypothetical protein